MTAVRDSFDTLNSFAFGSPEPQSPPPNLPNLPSVTFAEIFSVSPPSRIHAIQIDVLQGREERVVKCGTAFVHPWQIWVPDQTIHPLQQILHVRTKLCLSFADGPTLIYGLFQELYVYNIKDTGFQILRDRRVPPPPPMDPRPPRIEFDVRLARPLPQYPDIGTLLTVTNVPFSEARPIRRMLQEAEERSVPGQPALVPAVRMRGLEDEIGQPLFANIDAWLMTRPIREDDIVRRAQSGLWGDPFGGLEVDHTA